MDTSSAVPEKRLWRPIVIFLLAFLTLVTISKFVDPHCTLDASYYHVMASQLDQGEGFTEPVIWQHLNHYDSLEHPMDYWMPLGIIAYHITRYITGAQNELYINFFLWSLLAVLIFNEIYKFTRSGIFAWLGCFMFIFQGRNLCYLLTTDNCAFSATIGFFLIKTISEKKDSWKITAIISGINSLLRIEGLLFAVFTGFLEYRKTRSLKVAILFFAIVAIVISPWVIRNLTILGKPWTSNTKALFLESYKDFFDDGFSGNFKSFINQGFAKIAKQRLSGFIHSLVDLFIMPSIFVMFPLLFAGTVIMWDNFGRYFVLFLTFSLSICSLIFPLQTEFGTAMHISAMFYPFFAILSCVGLNFLVVKYSFSSGFKLAFASIIIAWCLLISVAFIFRFNSVTSENENPYKDLLRSIELKKTDRIVSHRPVLVYRLSGCHGVMGSDLTTSSPAKMADRYDCNVIITDLRNLHKEKISESDWELIDVQPLLRVYRRKTPAS